MVRVIKKGSLEKRTKCYKCGSELGYFPSECRRQQSHMQEWQYFITCPVCGDEICVDCKEC